ncbi:restriction endonuclease subunit S, partial [Glutamicibacter arilaitensis]|uniref:restriction endonuclease subunit S n=1 Tax=Glutamicibacter arilaitensis TaxID=256701 RepID=UPI003F8D9B2E
LEAELEAELEARNQQYAHYRDDAFEGVAKRNDWKPLSSVGQFERGSALQKKDLVDSGIPCFHYGQVYTFYGVSAEETKSFVTNDFAQGKRVLNPGDVFVATTSENEEDLGKAVAWIGKEPAVASSDAYIFRSELDARFVSYFFASSHFHSQKKRFITGTKVKRLSGDAMGKIEIPVPDLKDQIRIADLLDKFDAIVNDLSRGLPAELNARRKQYEYYRDQLLSFKELVS